MVTARPKWASRRTVRRAFHAYARDTGAPAPFIAPDRAVKHEDPSIYYQQGRLPKEKRGGFWWLDIGVPYHMIYDAETIRHELTRRRAWSP